MPPSTTLVEAGPPGLDTPNWAELNRNLKVRWDELTASLDVCDDPRRRRRLEQQRAQIEAEFITANENLWRAATRKLRSVGNHSDDLLNVARATGWELFRSWDPDQADFPAYAKQYLRGAINRAVWAAEADGISYGTWSARPEILRAEAELRTQLGRSPTHQELAELTGFTAATIEAVRTSRRSIDADADNDDGAPHELVDATVSAADQNVELTVEDLAALTAALNAEECYVLIRRFGLFDPPAGCPQIGVELGYPGEKIRRIELRALAKLRDHVTASST